MTRDWSAIEEQLRKALTESRFRHTMGVTYTACALAMQHGVDLEQARLAGLLHDCAKCIPEEKQVMLCREKLCDVDAFSLAHPALLHAKLGRVLAEEEYGITDQDVLSAIACHTTGKPAMTALEKILYVADYIEPNRDRAPNLALFRLLAFTDLDRCVELILRDTVEYLHHHPKATDPMTAEAYAYYQQCNRKRKNE